ncbi:conserved hypothetical protein [Echinococcus multilocularis]|uniref:Uncharacterized protein n=1 Tax=Echinococcus multilocularis TaxID=6211 RepID=A0A068YAM6_ECHMU|nr:conserved hypothetical protein [Echinococcus multilocularis]
MPLELGKKVVISNHSPILKRQDMGCADSASDDRNEQQILFPKLHGSKRILPSTRADSISFQCRLLKQKNKERNLLEQQLNASFVVETKEELNQNKEMLSQEGILRQMKAEKTLDQIIRSTKPSFVRARPSTSSEKADNEDRNISNVENFEGYLSDPKFSNERDDKSVGSPNSSKERPVHEVALLDSTGESHDKFNDSSMDNQEPNFEGENVFRKYHDGSAIKFQATTEYIELPLSKEKARVPLKKILPVKYLPTDPLTKLRKEKRLFSVGFKVTDRTDSNKTLNDNEQIHVTALIRLCEAYTKNLGSNYLRALAKESVIPLSSSYVDETKHLEWHGGAKIVEDATERLWNWEKSLINSNLLRDYQGRPVFNKDLDIRHISESPDIYQVSLGPNEYDAKSDLGALLIKDSDSSTDVEFDEVDFIIGHSAHPFTDSIILAGGLHPSKARDRYLMRQKANKDASQSTGVIHSQINSIQDENADEDMNEETIKEVRENLEGLQAVSPLSVGAEAGGVLKTPTETTFTSMEPTSTTATSASLPEGGPEERQKAPVTTTTSLKALAPQKHRRGNDATKSKAESKRQDRTRFTRRNRGDKRARDPIEIPNEFPVDNLRYGFENVAVDWCEIITAAGAPNPMCWFEAMEAMENYEFDKVSMGSEDQIREREVYGLGRRFITVAGGLEGLYTMLKHTVEPDQPKAEVLLDCMVKNYKLQMPLAVGDAVRLRELYKNTILKNPMLYKMVLRRRSILPEDLQAFVAKIIETTESSDDMLAALYPSKSNSELIFAAAKEMFTSGYLTGGPPCPVSRITALKCIKKPERVSGDDDSFPECGRKSPNLSVEEQSPSAGVVACSSEVNFEKAFHIGLSNPSRDILQEVAYHIPEFAYHIRPVFETKWVEIGSDRSCEVMLPQLCELRNMRQRRLEMVKLGLILTEKEESDEGIRVRQLSHDLVERLCYLLTCPNTNKNSGIWMGLLACFHGIMFWPPIGDCLVSRLNVWIPALLLTLQSAYATVREEGCCVLAFLACCYPLFCRLQTVCRNLLISNMTFALLDAMDRYPDSYACFHGTLAYILHSVPSNAVMDCLLIWIPDIIHREGESLLARDWPLFIYYVARHWPTFAINWNLLYNRQVVKLLECGLARRISKHNARLALGHLVGRRGLISSVFTVWRDDENKV